MDLSSAVLKRTLEEGNVEIWARIKPDLIPSTKLKTFFKEVNKYFDTHSRLPPYSDLGLILGREKSLLETLAAVNSVEVDISAEILFDYLKAEYAQTLILGKLETYLKNTVTFESAEDSIDELQNIVLEVQQKALDDTSDESMQRIELFESEEELEKYIPLGLNNDFDIDNMFGPGDYIMIGGKRGQGKSVVCANLSHHNLTVNKKSTMYFSIEMDTRDILHRHAAIATQIDPKKFSYKRKDLSDEELLTIAHWWASRYENGSEDYIDFIEHKNFDRLHASLRRKELTIPRLEIIYDTKLTLTKIRSELSKKVKMYNVGMVIIDYVNQVRRTNADGAKFSWEEQVEISTALKEMASEFGVIMVSPYQMDATGEARFAKGILDAADAAFTLNAHTEEAKCISFMATKRRRGKEVSFHSYINWDTITIGPETAQPPQSTAKSLNKKKKEPEKDETEEGISDF